MLATHGLPVVPDGWRSNAVPNWHDRAGPPCQQKAATGSRSVTARCFPQRSSNPRLSVSSQHLLKEPPRILLQFDGSRLQIPEALRELFRLRDFESSF